MERKWGPCRPASSVVWLSSWREPDGDGPTPTGLVLHSETHTGFSLPLPRPQHFPSSHPLPSTLSPHPPCPTTASGRGGREEPGACSAPWALLTTPARGRAGGPGNVQRTLSLVVSKHCSRPPGGIINYGDFCLRDQVCGGAQITSPGVLSARAHPWKTLQQSPNRARRIYQAQRVSTWPNSHCNSLCTKSAELETADFPGETWWARSYPERGCSLFARAGSPHHLALAHWPVTPTPTPQRPYLTGPAAPEPGAGPIQTEAVDVWWTHE